MRISKLLFLVVLASSVLFAQERIIITPSGDAIPVKKGETEYDAAKKAGLIGKEETPNAVQGVCPSSLLAGNVYDPARYTTNFAYAAGDVSAMIYVVPFSGNISAVHWKPNANTFTNLDATLRISKSTIRNSGNTAATYWGYFPNSNDPDVEQPGHVGNTPWPDDATGAYVPGAVGTVNPIGENLWGGEIGGFPITWPNGSTTQNINTIALGYEPTVTAGDTIIISIQKSAFVGSTTASNAVFRASAPEPPFRFLKYYYFGRTATAQPGWWSREFDMFIWFTITVTGDVPPTVESFTTINHTISTGPQTVRLTAYDCNIAAPADTGVASANLYYKVDAGSYTAIPMTVSSLGWSADIPGQALGSTVTYYADVTDIHAFTTTLGAKVYRVVDFNRANYVYSTPAFNFTNIAGDPAATELPGSAFQGTGVNDDGTAGPVAIGGNFNFFGRDTMQYAWVGANGALGLTGTATDTVWVNSNSTRTGSFANFSIPTSTAPRNWIAGFWNDLWLEPDGHGTVWYKQVGTQLIVQWNRVGNFNAAGDTTTTFQIVLDRADTSITFKYLDVGTTGLELSGYVAAQASSTDLWTFINGSGYPVESQPANNKSIKLKYTGTTGVQDRDAGIPSKFALYANFPNPFNPTTSINYDLSARGKVELTIYNLVGEKVAELVKGEQGPGTYVATWDGRNSQGQSVASGLYLYRLKAGSFLETRKMLLLK